MSWYENFVSHDVLEVVISLRNFHDAALYMKMFTQFWHIYPTNINTANTYITINTTAMATIIIMNTTMATATPPTAILDSAAGVSTSPVEGMEPVLLAFLRLTLKSAVW